VPTTEAGRNLETGMQLLKAACKTLLKMWVR